MLDSLFTGAQGVPQVGFNIGDKNMKTRNSSVYSLFPLLAGLVPMERESREMS